jgi:dihydroorotase
MLILRPNKPINMNTILITNAQIINEGSIKTLDILIKNGRIARIDKQISAKHDQVIDAAGLYAMPGVIDDQVHFREPGLTHKANIYSESRAAVAGGVTSFMEMPNTNPATLTQELLEKKYQIAAETSLANYSFFMGASNDNFEEVVKTNIQNVCGIKVFMGSSTGNMLVDNEKTLERIFSEAPTLVATHCEDEATIKRNLELVTSHHTDLDALTAKWHPTIRSRKACYLSSSLAVSLAKKHGTRLHVLHISTAKELDLFDNTIPLEQKKITSEVCVHHLYFYAEDYPHYGNLIKCNPAIKNKKNGNQLFEGLLDDRLDVIATDHAPHTREEKALPYLQAPSGLPLVQHPLNIMLDFHAKGRISLETMVRKMCHAPAVAFKMKDRGYLREGYWADIVLIDPNKKHKVTQESLLYKCNWSPFLGKNFKGKVMSTFVSGNLVFHNGEIIEGSNGQRLLFN